MCDSWHTDSDLSPVLDKKRFVFIILISALRYPAQAYFVIVLHIQNVGTHLCSSCIFRP